MEKSVFFCNSNWANLVRGHINHFSLIICWYVWVIVISFHHIWYDVMWVTAFYSTFKYRLTAFFDCLIPTRWHLLVYLYLIHKANIKFGLIWHLYCQELQRYNHSESILFRWVSNAKILIIMSIRSCSVPIFVFCRRWIFQDYINRRGTHDRDKTIRRKTCAYSMGNIVQHSMYNIIAMTS